MKEYISEINKSKINDLLKDENIDLIMKTMIHEYSKDSIERALNLISYVNLLVDNIIKNSSNQINELTQAGNLLIFQMGMNKSDINTYFASMVPIMKVLYPNGLDDNASLVQKDYFKQFIKLCKNKKAFSWNKESDVEWAKCYGYDEYLHMIFKKYIDE